MEQNVSHIFHYPYDKVMDATAFHENSIQHEKEEIALHVLGNVMLVNKVDYSEDFHEEIEVMKNYHLSKTSNLVAVLVVKVNYYLLHHIEDDNVPMVEKIAETNELVKGINFVLCVLSLLVNEVGYYVEIVKHV